MIIHSYYGVQIFWEYERNLFCWVNTEHVFVCCDKNKLILFFRSSLARTRAWCIMDWMRWHTGVLELLEFFSFFDVFIHICVCFCEIDLFTIPQNISSSITVQFLGFSKLCSLFTSSSVPFDVYGCEGIGLEPRKQRD